MCAFIRINPEHLTSADLRAIYREGCKRYGLGIDENALAFIDAKGISMLRHGQKIECYAGGGLFKADPVDGMMIKIWYQTASRTDWHKIDAELDMWLDENYNQSSVVETVRATQDPVRLKGPNVHLFVYDTLTEKLNQKAVFEREPSSERAILSDYRLSSGAKRGQRLKRRLEHSEGGSIHGLLLTLKQAELDGLARRAHCDFRTVKLKNGREALTYMKELEF